MKKQIQSLRAKGLTIRKIMKQVGLKSTSAVAHYLTERNPETDCLRCGARLKGWAVYQEHVHKTCVNKKCNRYGLVVFYGKEHL